MVKFETSLGDFVIALDAAKAPVTVANFLQYVDDGHFDGTVFHRVIPGFVIQGGGMNADMNQKPTRKPIENEATNGLKNLRGTLSMARTNDVNSATSQFFVNLADNKFLNYRSPDPQGIGYTVFGKIVEGMDVVNKIAKTPTGAGGPLPKDVPQKPVVINAATLLPAK